MTPPASVTHRYRPFFPRFPAPESPVRTPVWPAFLTYHLHKLH